MAQKKLSSSQREARKAELALAKRDLEEKLAVAVSRVAGRTAAFREAKEDLRVARLAVLRHRQDLQQVKRMLKEYSK